jgi:hypothetical protein
MGDIRVGDKVLCTKGCMCGCGLLAEKIYTVEKLNETPWGLEDGSFYLKEIEEESRDGARASFDFRNENYELELVKKELQLELF